MKNKIRAYALLLVFAILTVLSGLAFLNNVSAVVKWWTTFSEMGGDATLIPASCPGVLPYFDWSAVDYSCVTTFVPFLGFFLITLGLTRALLGRPQNPEIFPFFRGYDQLNIALGLIGTLWGIIIIGFFEMDSVTMGHLMMCLHTALFSTLMAVLWVFIADHAILRPLCLTVLNELQGIDGEDEDLIEVIDKLTASAFGLKGVWDGNREHLATLNDAIVLTRNELQQLGDVGKRVGDVLEGELTKSARSLISEMSEASGQLSTQYERLEKAMLERHAKLDASQAEVTGLVGTLTEVITGIQSIHDKFVITAEKISSENAALVSSLGAERNASGILRGKVAELEGESEGRQKQINELMEKIKTVDEAFNKRVDDLRIDNERLSKELIEMEGKKNVAVRDADESRGKAEKAEKLLEKIRSAFNI